MQVGRSIIFIKINYFNFDFVILFIIYKSLSTIILHTCIIVLYIIFIDADKL